MMRNMIRGCAAAAVLSLVSISVSAKGAPGPALDFDGGRKSVLSVRTLLESAPAHTAPLFKAVPARGGRGGHRGRAWNGARVRDLAVRIVQQAGVTRSKYRQEKPGNFFKKISWRSGYNPLKRFEDEAQDFNRAVKRRHRSAEDVGDAYMAMIEDWEAVQSSLPYAYRYKRIRGEHEKLEDLVADLRFFFRGLERRREARKRIKEASSGLREASNTLLGKALSLSSDQELSYEDRRFLDDLREVDAFAGYLEREVTSYSPDWRDVRRKAEKLVDEYRRADRAFYDARFFESLRYDFQNLGDGIDDLEDALEDMEGRRH